MRRMLRSGAFLMGAGHRLQRRFSFSEQGAALNKEELRQLAEMLEDDPKLLISIVGKLDAQSRRRLIVAGGAMEWFGKESAATEVERADADKDLIISPKDFDHWFESALRRRHDESRAERTVLHAGNSEDNKKVPFFTLLKIAFCAGLPFVGFGFFDNAVMILAGDAIDHTVGLYFNCSILACAAMGNIFSGVLGMQVHGVINKAVRMLNFRAPVLTESQMKGQRVFFAGHIGGTFGIMIGLLLGMLPLLFLESDEEKTDRALFQRWDTNGSGYLELQEVQKALTDLGFTKISAEKVMTYGTGGRLNFEEFQKICKDIRKNTADFA